MCQYSAVNGTPTDWHLVHLGARSVGGAALVMCEATAVARDGRITHGCTGIWNDEQAKAWKRIVNFAHEHSSTAIGLQIGHAGRKASCSLPWEGDRPLTNDQAWPTIGPTQIPFRSEGPAPKAMQRKDMDLLRDQYIAAAGRALSAGFDLLELHMAHGYLLSSFLSKAVNQRDDEYGGNHENRMRLPLEIFEAVRAVWPTSKPLLVRVSATDWIGERGQTIEETIQFAHALKQRGCDALDLSSAGNVLESRPDYGRMYQTPFAERVRNETGLATIAVGAVLGHDHANTILAAERADLVAFARPHLADPHLTMQAAIHYGHEDLPWPNQYLAIKPG
jgi:anthraniloyl-CoA monooxygenase